MSRFRISAAQKDKIVHLLKTAPTLTETIIGQRFGVSRDIVYKLAKEFDIDLVERRQRAKSIGFVSQLKKEIA